MFYVPGYLVSWPTGAPSPDDAGVFSSTPLPDRLWAPPSFLSGGYRGLFPRIKWPEIAGDHWHLLPRLRIRGALPRLPHTYSLAFRYRKPVPLPFVSSELLMELYQYFIWKLACSRNLVVRASFVLTQCTTRSIGIMVGQAFFMLRIISLASYIRKPAFCHIL